MCGSLKEILVDVKCMVGIRRFTWGKKEYSIQIAVETLIF